MRLEESGEKKSSFYTFNALQLSLRIRHKAQIVVTIAISQVFVMQLCS